MKKRFIVLIALIIVALIGSYLFYSEGASPLVREDVPSKQFIIPKGESVRAIANQLEKEGLIRSSLVFFLIARYEGYAEKFQAGNFHLSPSMSARTIAETLTRGSEDTWVTILEGWRNEEIALELAKNLNIPEQEFLNNANEGYMFPDTYLIPREASVSSVITMFENNFNSKVDETMKNDIKKQGYSLNDVVILASIVEREANAADDLPVVAGILRKRLEADWPLNVDASIQYALGYQQQEKRWWKRSLTLNDLKLDSPYNTYTNKGLPPGPISNPGLAALKAVVYPKQTEYWFYLHDPKGGIHYARTNAEHEENISTYLR